MQDEGIGGRAIVWLYVDAGGSVIEAQIHASAGLAALDEAAISVARTMRFSPARNRDQRVPVWIEIPIGFQVPR